MPMALSTQQGLEDTQYLLLAKIDNARNVSNILKAIHFKEVGKVLILIYRLGTLFYLSTVDEIVIKRENFCKNHCLWLIHPLILVKIQFTR